MKNNPLEKFRLLNEYNYDLKATQHKLFESFIKPNEINRYSHRMSESNNMFEDSNYTINEDNSNSNQSLVELITNNEFDVNSPEFSKSLKSGKRGEFLTDYTADEYGKMKTYKVKGYNVGFAIKSDGDIVSVHNNSGIGGVGSVLIQAAKSMGGTKLDHFDGFLTGLYSKNGFKVVGSDEWNDDYAPNDWEYQPVDIFNPQFSIYADELKKYSDISQVPNELKRKIELYKNGKPDIVYREIL